MGRILSRIALILGGALFAGSFFMPVGFMHAPFGMMQWMAEAVSSSESVGEGAAFCGATVAIAYPYAWALLVVAAALWNFSGKRSAWPWLHVAVQTFGGLTLMALCVLLLSLHDPWLPAKLQWTGAILPVVILVPIWGAVRFASRERRAWVVISLGLAPQLLLQAMLAVVSVGRAGQAVGFVVGSLGALIALAGGIGSACFQRRATGDGEAPLAQRGGGML